MATTQELFEIVYDLLDEVDLYEHQVRDLYYNNAFAELDTSRARKNYDRILRRLESVNMPDPEKLINKTMNLDELKEYLEMVLNKILGSEYEEDIKVAKSFISPKPYSQIMDVKTSYKIIGGIETPTEFIVSKKHNPIQLANIANSEVTVLLRPLYKDFNNTIGNIHYQKLPGIIATYIAIYELSEILKQQKLVSDYEDVLIYSDVKYAKRNEKEIIDALPKYRRKGVSEFNEHSKFSYLISDVYSTSLIEAYLNDEEGFLKQYRDMIKGNVSVPEYLKYYGMSLTNPSVTAKYQDKITEVEKRYQLK